MNKSNVNIIGRDVFISSFIILFSFLALNSKAQDYYFENTTIDTVINQSEVDLFAKVKIPFINNLQSNSTFQWIKTETNLPPNWLVSICDESYCYEPEIEMGLTNIPPQSNYEFAIQLYPFNTDNQVELNSGSISLEVAADFDNIQIATINFETVAYTNDQILLKKNIKIYPNPCLNQFNFDALNTQVYQINIFDLEGKLVLKSHENNFDVSALSNGIYLVNFMNAHQELISSQKLVVQ